MHAEITRRDFGEHVLVLVMGIALWIVESYSAASALVFSLQWTAVGAAVGVTLFAFLSFSAVVVAFQRRLRESKPFLAAVTVVGFTVVLLSVLAVDVTVRPEHYSGFLGLGLSQLLGIALYLRQRTPR